MPLRAFVWLLVFVPTVLPAQALVSDNVAALAREPAVLAAMQRLRDGEERTIADQMRLCEVPAPPFEEGARAQLFAEMLRDGGLQGVRLDREGNVVGVRPGQRSSPQLVVGAHLDTVFPAGTPVKPTRDGVWIRGPGIADNCRGLAVLVAVARALKEASIETPGPITFVGTVGEEGLGDLRGVKALVGETLKGRIDRYLDVDGAGLGMTTRGVGSRRFRVTFRGPGGHSYGAFGTPNPIHAAGRALAELAEIKVPRSPRTTFSVGRIGGGTSINAIPSEAWFEVDLRSEGSEPLRDLVASVQRGVEKAASDENARWEQPGVIKVEVQSVGERPSGAMAPDAPIVTVATAVTRALGLPVMLRDGSTDANLPMSVGIPALSIEAGGQATGGHALTEAFDTRDAWKGAQRALLLVLALAR